MKKLVVLAIVIGIASWNASGRAQAQERTGAGFSVMLGGSFCVKNGAAKCTDIDPSFGFSVSPSYRIMNYIGLGLDFVYGMYDMPNTPDISGIDLTVMGLTAGPILYLPLKKLDLFVGLSLGWMRLNIEVGSQAANADGFGLGLQAGLEYRVVENIGLGVMFRFNFNFAGELCPEGEGECMDIDEVAHNALVGGRISVYF